MPISKTVRGRLVPRGFESLPLRFRGRNPAPQLGFGRSRRLDLNVAVRRRKPPVNRSGMQRAAPRGVSDAPSTRFLLKSLVEEHD